MKAAATFTRKAIRATRLAAGDRRIPRWLRWVAGLALLPVPGPFDETLLLLVAVPLLVFYRRPLRDAWALAGAERQARAGSASAANAAGPTTGEVMDVNR
jgi:hypothetical protein